MFLEQNVIHLQTQDILHFYALRRQENFIYGTSASTPGLFASPLFFLDSVSILCIIFCTHLLDMTECFPEEAFRKPDSEPFQSS